MPANLLSQKSVQWIAFLIGVIALLVLVTRNDCSATDTSCFNLVQFSLNGLLVGGVYALVAVGIVIINKASGIFNFAHGFMMLFGGFMFWQTFNSTPSQNLSIIMGVIAGIIALTVVAILAQAPPAQGEKPSRLKDWNRSLMKQNTVSGWILRRLVALLMPLEQWFNTLTIRHIATALATSIITAVVVFFLLQELSSDILRGAVGALVGGIFLGLIVERFTIRPLLGQPTLTAIMMTLALALVMQGTISLIWGTNPHSLPIFVEEASSAPTVIQIGVDADGNPIYQEIENIAPPAVLPNYRVPTEDLLGKELSFQRNLVWGFGIAILSFIAFVFFFQFTNVGLAMRAVAENQVLAESAGLQVRTILAVAWAIATTMATIAAVIQGTGPGVGLSFLVIPPLAFRAFPAVLVGGLESITGALVGGLIIGVVETLASGIIDSNTGQQFAPFAVLLIVLIIRPEGLFGQKHIDRV